MESLTVFASPLDLLPVHDLDLGYGPWFTVDQAQVDAFAGIVGDRQWIHVDPARAASGPFGSTIVHGYLTLAFAGQALRGLYRVDGATMALNYGLDRVRFPAPVPVGARLRGHAVLRRAEFRRAEPAGPTVGPIPTAVQAYLDVTIEIDGQAKPACVASIIARFVR